MSRTVQIAIAVFLALVLLAICVVAAVLLVRTLTEREPTPVPTFTSEVGSGVDDSWERVQTAGKIVVGTSADYPPFEYYSGDAEIDGFDIALMDEIGRRLGIQVEFRNFAFDGLGNALQVGQIDAAIAAISVTPEREGVVDFSNVYFVGEDGLLANEDSDLEEIRSADELATLRIGVQRDTVHEDWVQTNLVDTGQLPEDNLLVYEMADAAVRDLQAQRLELVLMDVQPAEAFARAGGVKIVGRGMNQQRFAIALPKGAASLRAQIDGALDELHNEGVIAELAKQYLDQDALLPTPPPAPTSTPGPEPSCVDGLEFIEHLNYDVQDLAAPPEMVPGETFTKGWRVQNTGTCTWDSSYHLVFASGNRPAARMGGQPVAVEGLVEPGDTHDIEIDLVAPLRPGAYQAFWQMHNGGSSAGSGQAPSAGSGQGFGERLPVAIIVPAAPTPTPAPTQTPAPGITFTVDRDQIEAGECVVFSWKVENVKEVYFYAEGEPWQDHGVSGEGRQQECPPVTTTYYLRVVSLDNSVEVRQISIYVEPAPDTPQITRFTVDPPNQVPMGQCITIRWAVEGDVEEVTLTSNDVTLWEDAPLKGSIQDCPAGPATVAYAIEAVGPGGTSRQQQNIEVVAAATPEPTAPPNLPVIHAFSVTPSQIAAGECVGISWSVGGGASVIQILRNDTVVLEGTGFAGQQTNCLEEAGTYVYRLDAYNLGGQSVSQEETVDVQEGAPGNPLADTSWQATSLYDPSEDASIPVLEGTIVTATFGQNGMLDGSAGCNTYQAAYFVDRNKLRITEPGITQVLCEEPAGIMEQESAFLSALQAAAAYTIEGDQLYLTDAEDRVILEFIDNR